MPRYPLDSSDRKPIGKTGESVSAIGLGTWSIRNPRRAVEALVYAVELGIDNIDTAEMYGDGSAEKIVGEVLSRVCRGRVFVTTKLLTHRFRSPELAEKALKASLRRLKVSEVDLVLIHWPDSVASLEVQIRSLEHLAKRGLTRYIGVSNFDGNLLERALSLTKNYELVVDQVRYSVAYRRPEDDLLDIAIRRGVTLQAYTPIERGAVTKYPLIRKLAEKYGKTPVQIALNYLISRPRVVAIPKTERKERVEEFAGAMGWRLSLEDIELIENSVLE